MSHKINKDIRKAFSFQKTAKPRVPASPTAEIGDTRLESSVGTQRVSGMTKKFSKTIIMTARTKMSKLNKQKLLVMNLMQQLKR